MGMKPIERYRQIYSGNLNHIGFEGSGFCCFRSITAFTTNRTELKIQLNTLLIYILSEFFLNIANSLSYLGASGILDKVSNDNLLKSAQSLLHYLNWL